MDPVAVIVLAAGEGKRMKASVPKVLLPLGGKPLLHHVLTTAFELGPKEAVLVLGKAREEVEGGVSTAFPKNNVRVAIQDPPRGTGDAVRVALPELGSFTGTVIVLYGDIPLITPATLRSLFDKHHAERATVTVLTVLLEDPRSYGRIIRDKKGELIKIIEAKDCTPEESAIKEINSGIYAVDSSFLPGVLQKLSDNNAQGELYFTDVVGHAVNEGQTVSTFVLTDGNEVMGINDPIEMLMAEKVWRDRRIQELATKGVKFIDPDTVVIDASVEIAPGCTIGPNVQLYGKTRLSEGCVIEGTALLRDTEVGARAKILLGVRSTGAIIGEDVSVGPFAHLREGSILGKESKVGNFVETKNAKLAKGAKASHLTYLGDCSVGEDSNIGAGTITCNFDGAKKHQTTIGKEVFIGSNTALVAPVTLGDRVSIGAGSVITKDVQPDALALTRPETKIKEGWSKRRPWK